MTIVERQHVRKFKKVLESEGFLATQRFELVDAAWAIDTKVLSRSSNEVEKDIAALKRMLAIIDTARPFHRLDNGTDFWFTYAGSSRAHFFSRIDSPRGITVAIFKLVNDTPEIDAGTLISNYLHDDETVASESVAVWTIGDSADRFAKFSKILDGAQIKGIIERPYGAGLEFCLIKNDTPHLLYSHNVHGKPRYTLAQIFPL